MLSTGSGVKLLIYSPGPDIHALNTCPRKKIANSASNYHPVMRTLAHALKQHLDKPEHVIVAVSGGADSVALLRALHELSKRRGWQMTLSVLHVQHHVRETAEQDAIFTEALCEQLGVSFQRHDLKQRKKSEHASEEDLRAQRHGAFEKAGKRYFDESGIWPVIALAHHADDQLETMLMRLIRGTGPQGLAGMRFSRPISDQMPELKLVRPLLELESDQLKDYLREIDQTWCEDETNLDTRYTRNRLRHDVLPVLKAINPQASINAQKLSALLLASSEIDDNSSVNVEPLSGSRSDYRKLSKAAQAASLRRYLIASGLNSAQLPKSLIDQISRAIADTKGNRRTFDLAGGYALSITRSSFTLAPPEVPPPENLETSEPVEAGVGIGKVSGGWLREAGIKTMAQLRKQGSVKAYEKVRRMRAQIGETTSLNLLWALEGAVTDMHWTMLHPKEKKRLQDELSSISGDP